MIAPKRSSFIHIHVTHTHVHARTQIHPHVPVPTRTRSTPRCRLLQWIRPSTVKVTEPPLTRALLHCSHYRFKSTRQAEHSRQKTGTRHKRSVCACTRADLASTSPLLCSSGFGSDLEVVSGAVNCKLPCCLFCQAWP